jgi:hypothetical protein
VAARRGARLARDRWRVRDAHAVVGWVRHYVIERGAIDAIEHADRIARECGRTAFDGRVAHSRSRGIVGSRRVGDIGEIKRARRNKSADDIGEIKRVRRNESADDIGEKKRVRRNESADDIGEIKRAQRIEGSVESRRFDADEAIEGGIFDTNGAICIEGGIFDTDGAFEGGIFDDGAFCIEGSARFERKCLRAAIEDRATEDRTKGRATEDRAIEDRATKDRAIEGRADHDHARSTVGSGLADVSEESLTVRPRIYADFNGLRESPRHESRQCLPLDTWGALRDLSTLGTPLREGTQLVISSDSAEDEDLEADAIALYDPEQRRWYAEIEGEIRYVPHLEWSTTFL